MTAHVGDFGLVRVLSGTNHLHSSNETSSLAIKGSIGYAAPEYGMGSELSTSGDVYSYGILLLEMFTGKRPTDGVFNDGLNLHSLAKMALPERVLDIADSRLFQTESETTNTNMTPIESQPRSHKVQECLIATLKIGVVCSSDSPRERMDIGDVVAELQHIKNMLHGTRTHE